MLFLKEFFEKVDLEKKQHTKKCFWKITQNAKTYAFYYFFQHECSLTKYYILTLYLLESSADNFCKQFGPRSGPTKCRAWSGSKMFDTDGIPERIFRKGWFWQKITRQQKSTKNCPGGRVKFFICCSHESWLVNSCHFCLFLVYLLFCLVLCMYLLFSHNLL